MFICCSKEETIDVTIDDVILLIWKEPNFDGLSKATQYIDTIKGTHGLIMTLLYYHEDLRDCKVQLYYDQHVDYMTIIEEAENFVKDLSDPKNVTCMTPRSSKRVSTQLLYNYIVKKDQKILNVLADTSDYDSEMNIIYNKLTNLLDLS